MPQVAKIVDNIGLLWTMDTGESTPGASAGRDAMRTVGAIKNAAVAISNDGLVLAVGPRKEVTDIADTHTEILDAEGGFACPGFVDPHTHLVHGGSREKELPLRIAGASYLDILRGGGGILSTVKETTSRSEDDLYAQAKQSLARIQQYGVTTIEAKTGYGLNADVEMKQLRVARELEQNLPGFDFVHTAMPAHAIPPHYAKNRTQWIDEIIAMLPRLQALGATFADVFVEEGVFTAEEGLHILLAARNLGFKTKIHADEMVSCGGAELAASIGATSADHLLAASDSGLHQMAEAGVVAVCLPGTSFYLQKQAARTRFMIDEANLAVAIASDYNPGSCPTENFGLIMSLALFTLHLTPEEIFVAATRNAAAAVAKSESAGMLRVGRQADLVVFHAPNPEYVLTHFGVPHVKALWKRGQQVVG